MVVGIVSLRKLLARVKSSARRAATFLRKIQNTSLKQPSMKVVERNMSDIQDALGHFKTIIEIFERISE